MERNEVANTTNEILRNNANRFNANGGERTVEMENYDNKETEIVQNNFVNPINLPSEKILNINIILKTDYSHSEKLLEIPLKRINTDNESVYRIKKSEIKVERHETVSDDTCQVCFNAKSDSVVLPCCHGGICFSCAERISKQGAKCAYCRQVFFYKN